MSQQLYISPEAWFELIKAKERIISLVNHSASQLPLGASGAELGKRVIEGLVQAEVAPTHHAILVLKAELQRIFKY